MTLLNEPTQQIFRKNQNPGWSDDKIIQLRKHCADGLSAGQIARKLGFATRNAVIGKIHRLGLVKGLRHDQRTELQTKRLTGSSIKPHNVHPQNIHKAHYTRKKRLRIALTEPPGTTPTGPVYIPSSEYDRNIPLEQRKTLLELNSITCRWPIGSPTEPDFFFCGAITDHTYCRHHASRAYKA